MRKRNLRIKNNVENDFVDDFNLLLNAQSLSRR
jgi:hypothetical protein